MYTNLKFRIHPPVIYLLKVSNGKSRTRYVICPKLTNRRHRNDLTSCRSDVSIVSILFLNFGKCCQLGLPAVIKVLTRKNYETYMGILCQLCHINQTGHTKKWKETCIEFKMYVECRLWANIYEIYRDFRSKRIISSQEKTVVETALMAITDSSEMHCCFDRYLINTFMKSTTAERSTEIMFKLTLHCLSVTVEDLNLCIMKI